jgi:hypothetical protein
MNDSLLRYAKSSQTIATFQAKAGQAARVRELAQKENDPLLRAYILVGMAEGLHSGSAPKTPMQP